MEGGSRSERENKDVRKRGEKPGSVLEPNIEPFVPRKGYDPNELRSWAKKTGFVSTFSGDTQRSASGRNNGDDVYGDLERGDVSAKNDSISPKIEIDPILGRTRRRGPEIEPVRGCSTATARERDGVLGFKDGVERGGNGAAPEVTLGTNNASRTEENEAIGNGQGGGHGANMEPKSSDDVSMYRDGEDIDDGGWNSPPKLIFGLKDRPGYG